MFPKYCTTFVYYQLLGCPEEYLEKALTSRTVETRGDKVPTNVSVDKKISNIKKLVMIVCTCLLIFVLGFR